MEMVKEGRVSRKTEEIMQNPVFPRDEIASMANLWWDICLAGKAEGRAQTATAWDIRGYKRSPLLAALLSIRIHIAVSF
ncbi:MAG: hypothetical protein V1766_14055 [Pseudomonadota bacterium]